MELLKQVQITEEFQGILMTVFSLTDNFERADNLIIDKFLKSNSFAIDCLPEKVRQNNKNPEIYLRQLFDNQKISIEDFRELNEKEICNFFISYSNESDWGKDRKAFKILVEKFKTIICDYPSDKFYLISKDWFDKDNDKMKNPENWMYLYYFLVIWFDKEKRTLIVCEWNYD